MWVLVFTLIGTGLLYWFDQGVRTDGNRRFLANAFFSLDRLLPRIVQLDKKHDDIEAELRGPVRYYFYLHKAIGFVLAGFLLAGLAGLTQQ